MARKINLNSPEIYQKLGTPSITPRTTTSIFLSPQEKKRSLSIDSTIHIQSPDFSKQLPKRFVAYQTFPLVSTKVPRVPAPDIKRTTGRNFMSIYLNKSDHKDYNPNYNVV